MMSTARKYPQLPRRQAGLSLVELMISLTIGLVLLAGITSLIVQQSGTRREMEKTSRQIENGRYAMDLLHSDIGHAGYYGDYAPANYVVPNNPCDPPNLTAAANLGWDSASSVAPVAVYGYDPSATNTIVCLDKRKPGTSALVVRRTLTVPLDVVSAAAATTYLQTSRCGSEATRYRLATTDAGAKSTSLILRRKDCITLSPLRDYIVRIYYIRTCSAVCTGAGDGIPTLAMVENGRAPIPLAEGIELLEFEYGVDTNGDGAPDGGYVMASNVADWGNVVSVRASLLARNNETTPGQVDTKSYLLGSSAVAAANDGYKRHVYSQVARVTNTSGRKEKP